MLMFLNKLPASLYIFDAPASLLLVWVTEVFLDLRLLASALVQGRRETFDTQRGANCVDISDLRLNIVYRRVQVVTEYSLVHVSHSTLQHHTNLQRHLTSFVCSTVLCPRPHELQSDLHLLVVTSSLLHALPSKPSEPAVLFRTQ